MSETKRNTRDVLLDAAEDVLVESGVVKFTLDAVAKRAEVSKGGLLYHFPSKGALFEAMVQRLVENCEEARVQEREKLPPSPSREIKAHLLACFQQLDGVTQERTMQVKAALLAAVAHDPSILRPMREADEALFSRFVAQGMRPERAAVVALALDGMMIMELLRIHFFGEEVQKGILAELLRLADEGEDVSQKVENGERKEDYA